MSSIKFLKAYTFGFHVAPAAVSPSKGVVIWAKNDIIKHGLGKRGQTKHRKGGITMDSDASAYIGFAPLYDELMMDVPYEKWGQ
ncbi:MAG: hypothetical protein FWG38_10270, partial [Defluviitaleaceae bacterium]|nr:hypothetical protein [Defluviitaleaceae bacterium]